MSSRIEQVISPIDGSVYAEYALASGDAIEAAIERAVAAQAAWKRVSIAERGAICRRMVAWMVERADETGTELTWQMGRPVAHSPFEIRRGFDERSRHMIDIAAGALADIGGRRRPGFERFIRRDRWGSCWCSHRGTIHTSRRSTA
jgi:acyl-CoA reductase-like NAD-dependent aldehyde dehydrogenase